MKKTICLLQFLFSITTFVHAQFNADDTTLSKMKLNFVVPDIPAFKVIGTDPTNLLQPSTPKALAISLSSFNDNGKFIIPRAFALELSPSLILNSNKGPEQLEEYAKNAVANSFRISIGSSADSATSSSKRNLAFGARISLINEGDFGTDPKIQKAIAGELRSFRKSSDTALKEFAISKGLKEEYDDDNDIFLQNHQKEFNQYLSNENEVHQKSFLSGIKKLKEDYKKEHWNDNKMDLAVAVLTASPDSLLKGIKFHQAEFWLTFAHKINKSNKAQFLVGLNAQVLKDLSDTSKDSQNKSYFNLSVPVRYLFGTNKVKGYGEGQYNYDGLEKSSKLTLGVGAEVSIIDGVWVNLYGGFDYDSKTATTSTVLNFNLKLTLPENFKFF